METETPKTTKCGGFVIYTSYFLLAHLVVVASSKHGICDDDGECRAHRHSQAGRIPATLASQQQRFQLARIRSLPDIPASRRHPLVLVHAQQQRLLHPRRLPQVPLSPCKSKCDPNLCCRRHRRRARESDRSPLSPIFVSPTTLPKHL